VRHRIVPELDDARVTIERSLHGSSLDSAPSSVHDPHFDESRLRGGVHIFLHD
jgi:hypothetical protein